jgi:hypothetical protein
MKLGERQDTMREFVCMKTATQRELFKVLAADQTLREDVFRTCISCDNWNHVNEICDKWKQRPPAKIIANGCDDYSDIPF